MRANLQADLSRIASIISRREPPAQAELLDSLQYVEQPDLQDVVALAQLLGADPTPAIQVLAEQQLIAEPTEAVELPTFVAESPAEGYVELHVKEAPAIIFDALSDEPVGAKTVDMAALAIARMYLEEGTVPNEAIANRDIPLGWGKDKTGDIQSEQLIFEDSW
jgi:hypothetical protein